MNKKCINCKFCQKFAYTLRQEFGYVCKAKPGDNGIGMFKMFYDKKELYRFNNCKDFKEKDFTQMDSLWKMIATSPTTKKKVGDITLRELNNLCKPPLARDCNKCPLLDKDTYICLACDKQFEREVEIDE